MFDLQVYLPWEKIIPNGTFQGATVIGLLVFFSYAIVLNTVVPISLYVSVEVRVAHNHVNCNIKFVHNLMFVCLFPDLQPGYSFRSIVSDKLGRENVLRKDENAGQSPNHNAERRTRSNSVHFFGQNRNVNTKHNDLQQVQY